MCGSCSSSSSFFNDPIAYAMAAKQQSVNLQIGFAVQATSLNAQRGLGDAMVALIDSAAQLGKEIGKGTLFDATA